MRKINSIILIVFLMTFFQIYFYQTNIKRIDKNDIGSIFISTFFHKKVIFLLSNIYSLFHFIRLQEKIGSVNFFKIFSILVILNTFSDYIYFKLNSKKHINNGLSGVLFGILVWDMMTDKKVNNEYVFNNIITILLLLILKKEHMSFQGHITGIMWGAILSIFYK
jgi:membrane associated rhomboid family serine protease